MKTLPLVSLGLLIAVGGSWALFSGDAAADTGRGPVLVERGTIVRNAVAVGRVEPARETPVKSLRGGIVTKLFARLGQKVGSGEPIAEVRPVTTEETFIQAERAVEAATEGVEAAREFVDGEHPLAHLMRFMQGSPNIERMRTAAERSKTAAEQRLELLRDGVVEVDGRRVDYVVRSPVAGHVLEVNVLEGSPVVPSSSYGSGTVLVSIGDLDRPVFRGTVDEIDVGRLEEGMAAAVTIGALPGLEVRGELVEVGLKSRQRNNAVLFDIRLELEPPEETVLRSGYSAVAHIELARRDDVLVLPERVVDFRGGRAFVEIRDDAGQRVERAVETGLSDGLRVEITSGLLEHDPVLERVH